MRQVFDNIKSYRVKNNKVILIALVIGLFFLLAGKAFANNLLGNPGFEQGVVTGWTNMGPNWVAENQIVYSGDLSAQNTIGTMSGQNYYASLWQDFNLPVGQTIYATLKTKTNIDPRSLATAGLLIEFYNGNDRISYTQDEIGGITDWRNLYVSATVPANTTRVRYSAFVFATQAESQPGGIALGGQAYFDEAVLSTDYIAPPPNQAALNNPGFENGLHDWTLLNSIGGSLLVDDQVKYEGNFSAKNIVGYSNTQSVFASVYQDMQYLGGLVYASAYVKTNFDSTSPVAGLKIEYYNISGSPIGSSVPDEVPGTVDWRRLLINGVQPPSETATLRLHCYTYDKVNGTGQGKIANFDNVIFSYSPLNPKDFRTTILNPGLENNLVDWADQYGYPSQLSSVHHGLGSSSAQKTIHVLTPARDYYSQIYQDIYRDNSGTIFTDNTPVYATAYVKTAMSPITKSKGGLQFEFIDDQGKVITDTQSNPIVVNSSVGGNTDWRYLYVTKQTPPGTQRVRVSGFEFARQQDASLLGDAYYDDFQFSLIPLTPPASQSNLLNSGFENGLNDWDELNFPGEVTTNPVHSGSYAAVFTVSDKVLQGVDYFGRASQDIAVSPGRNVSAAIWVKTSINPETTSTVAGLSLTFLNTAGVQVGSEIKQQVGNQPAWTKLVVNGIVPSGASKVRISAYLFAGGALGTPGEKAYFDDATLNITVPPGCFLAGTLITMADGSQKPIEKISVGDIVLAFDENSKQMKPDKVTQIFKHDKEDTFLIVNGQMKVTPIHRVLSQGNWIEIGKLKIGDSLTDTNGKDVAIKTIEVVNKKVDIYNFEVNPYHTYVADGFIVHNRKPTPIMMPSGN